ncbi:MAG: FixH family protein [Acidobacteria bacterium]|uniref:FixH family protein n=1 Tax=Candidatus Polarisedimenticola svalbardensis TaxID=2886004 RepID=A0A8J6Y0A6_9BACT|nr:FixH family protein [Candidatus Polarisedimenticola svalbardensis]
MKIPGWFWIAFATVILVGGLLAGAIMLFVSWNHPSLTADEDYYQRAVGYDEVKAQEARNLAMGWTLELETRRMVNAGVRETRVGLQVADVAGGPLEGADVTVEAFHLARSGDRFHAVLPAVSPGEYAAFMPLRRVGIWEFRFVIRRDDEMFTAVLEREF